MKNLFKQSGYYKIRIIPGQARTEIRAVMDDGTIKIALAAQPIRGQANKELIRYLAEISGRPKHAITISSGLISRIKVVHLDEEKD